MKTVAVALAWWLRLWLWPAPTIALPPEDLAAYCRAVYPQIPFQVRCMSLERASQDRLAAARSAVRKPPWDRCHNGSASWSAMESCLAQPATASAPARVHRPPAGGGPSEPADDRADARRQGGEGGGAPAPAEARTAPSAPATPPPPAASASGSGSTIILGPQANPALTAPPDNRPSRPCPKPRPIDSCAMSSSAPAKRRPAAPSANTVPDG